LTASGTFDSAVSRTRTREQSASPELLPRLAEAVHREYPELDWLESWTPCDIRAEVQVR